MRQPSKTSLFAAAKRWDAATVASILAQAPELANASDPKGRTALHLACGIAPGGAQLAESHGLETVAALLAAGCELEREVPMDEDEDDFRATPLWYAVARGENLPLVTFLVARGANASYSLWAAVWRDDEAMCRVLLGAKPELNPRAHGETPIFYAARLQRLKTLQLLIDAGADAAIADPKGRNALDIARARRLPAPLVSRLEALVDSATSHSTARSAS
ncbi:ankyrin repeat domain-containing protein [Acidovorax cavernicola]|uniref:Ankyrin repeat domain-containing protein n=1 Tax=Acidovorax cavernicola TaxID=1675792 RepID=A0A9X8D6H0_9BURK|nr:ankyrin repeat domain-containing protein [Acidovorax cavernicola]RIX82051.1 ankyrin repeat domain-containing protein [Acidovorax cavernicola]